MPYSLLKTLFHVDDDPTKLGCARLFQWHEGGCRFFSRATDVDHGLFICKYFEFTGAYLATIRAGTKECLLYRIFLGPV